MVARTPQRDEVWPVTLVRPRALGTIGASVRLIRNYGIEAAQILALWGTLLLLLSHSIENYSFSLYATCCAGTTFAAARTRCCLPLLSTIAAPLADSLVTVRQHAPATARSRATCQPLQVAKNDFGQVRDHCRRAKCECPPSGDLLGPSSSSAGRPHPGGPSPPSNGTVKRSAIR
jgi:hypothetical protein